MKKISKHVYIDLFAGCGGASLGLFKSGWKGLFAIEKNKMAFETIQFNLMEQKSHFDWPLWLKQKPYSISFFLRRYRKELVNLKGKVDLLVGGPPCQGFSFAGQRNENDKRNKLVNSYIQFIKIVQPKIIFFENVKGFTVKFKKNNSSGRIYSSYVLGKLSKLGYDVQAKIINFGEFGVPQERKRFILVGIKGGNAEIFFEKLFKNKENFLKQKGLSSNINLKDAISDLERKHGEEDLEGFKGFLQGIYGEEASNYQKLFREGYTKVLPDSHRFANHAEKTIEKFSYILDKCSPGKNARDTTKKVFKLNKHSIFPLDNNKRSPTLTTLPDDYIHYSEPRILSVREYARIQSFDDWYEIKGAYTTGGKERKTAVPRYSQIGNAIPPLFMEQAGKILKELVH